MKLEIWMVSLSGPDVGIVIRAFLEEVDARSYVQNYVHEQWNDGYMGDAEFPNDLDDAVQQYFEANEEEEWYCIRRQVLNIPQPNIPQPPEAQVVGDDIVDLDEEELEIVGAALNYLGPIAMAKELDMHGAEACAKAWDRVQILKEKLKP